MGILNPIRSFIGSVKVEESGGKIRVSALKTKTMFEDIFSLWRTNRIATQMFLKVTPYQIEFYSFFAVEFVYIVDRLLEFPKLNKTSKRSLSSVKNAMLENTWLKDTLVDYDPILDRSKLKLFKYTPKEHQVEFFDKYDRVVPKFKLRGYTLAMKTGTGKTYSSLALSQMLHSDFTIIITLKRAVYQVWEKAMNNDFNTPPKYWIHDRDRELKGNPPPFLIFHVEDLRYFKEIASKFRGKKVTLILDESHTLNEETSQRNNIMYEAWKMIEPMSTIWASATPLKAYGSEAITMLRTIDPLMTDAVAEAFKKIYGKSSSKVFDIISHRLGNIVFKADVVKTDPKIERVPVKIPDAKRFLLSTLKEDMGKFINERLKYWDSKRSEAIKYYNESLAIFEKTLSTNQQKQQFALYRKMFNIVVKSTDYVAIKDTIVFVNKYEKNVLLPALDNERRKQLRTYLSAIKYVELKVRGECLGALVSKRREEAVLAIIKYAKLEEYIEAAEKKTVVFTSYVQVVEKCAEYLKTKGIDTLVVHGSSEGSADSEVKKFASGNSQAMVTTFQSLSSAVPLTMANTILALNVPFRDYNMEQAIGRIDRIDQDAPTFVFEFILDTGKEENINSRTFDILQWSTEQVNAMLDIPDGV
ncbi:helicase [Serratia phage vB_SmaS-Totoro]|nr:helicase [Serratia phage vB_SmaS-Totoro]